MTIAPEVMALGVGECSCGEPDCRELGDGHEWNPDMDDCVLCVGGDPLDATAVRWGCGYAHPDCADPPSDEVEPLLWEGDDG